MAAVRLQTTVALAVAAFGFVVISAVMLIGNPPAWISAGGFTALTLMLVVTGGYAVVLNRQQPANLRLRRRARKATTTLVMANIAVQVGIVVVTVADASNLDSWLS